MSSPTPPFLDPSLHDSLNNLLTKLSQTTNLKPIKPIHAHLLRTGLIFISHTLQTTLTYTYTKPSKTPLQTLTTFFKSSIITHPLPFNSLLSTFTRTGHPSLTLKTLTFMHTNNVPIDTYTLCSSLTALNSLNQGLIFGTQIHNYIIKSGWGCSVYLASGLIDLYAKSVRDARKVFDEMPERNTVCANALLSAYTEAKIWGDGLALFRTIPGLGLPYDSWTFSLALTILSNMYLVGPGKEIHAKAIRTVHDPGTDVFLTSSLIDFYGKCGEVGKARRVFNMARVTDVVMWTLMLGVYGRNGCYEEVILMFKDMLVKRVRPDGVAFVIVISACGHTGRVDLGVEYFNSMGSEFGVKASVEHYGCLVDLFCRAGEVEKAWEVVKKMGDGVSVSVWGALLSACCENGNVEMGKFAGGRALELEPMNTGVYVLLSNMYAKYGLWDEIEELRGVMRDKGVKKDVGCSWIEVSR